MAAIPCGNSFVSYQSTLPFMKKSYTLLLAVLSSAALQAQTRIVSLHIATYDGTQYKTFDSVNINYNTGNSNHGGPNDYSLGYLKYNEDIRTRPNPSTGALYTSHIRSFEYDANWNKTKYTRQIPNPPYTGALTNDYQERYFYDANGYETSRVGFKWNTFTTVWDTTNRETRAYDANNNLLSLNTELYYSPNGFRGNLLRHYTYDANNNMTEYIVESWVVANTAYDTFSRQINHYNANQEMDTTYYEMFNRTTRMWEPSSKVYYVYTNGAISEYMHMFWVNGQYENRYLTLTTINSTNNMIVNEYKTWDLNTNAWLNATKDSTYDIGSNPRVNETIYYSWSPSRNLYDTTWRVRTSYNADDYPTVGVRNTWDAANGQWYINNNDDSTVWRYEGNTSNSVNGIGNNAPTLKLYPNPANGSHITLQVSTTGAYTIAIYSLQGALMAQQYVADGAQQKTIPVAHLASGQYILSITSKEGRASRIFSVTR